MTECLQTIYIWISRIAYCRGFGIQSPSAYRFVRYVINEHYPYYAYAKLKQNVRVANRRMLRLMRLYMRIVNYVQPEYIIDMPDRWKASRQAYYKAGSCKAVIINMEEQGNQMTNDSPAAIRTDGKRVVIRTDVQHINTVQPYLNCIDSASIIIIDGIHRNAQARHNWKTLTNNESTGICFDLYYTGIIMMDKSKHKRCYRINY